jgi:hypothetical protein
MDAFWVEATAEEAEANVFPRLQPQQVAESQRVAEQHIDLAEHFASREAARGVPAPPRPFCFLVARDLSTIDPFHIHYPVHQLWNAYSPFRKMPEREIAGLEDLASIDVQAQA